MSEPTTCARCGMTDNQLRAHRAATQEDTDGNV